jgi:hypothetical protein
MTVDPSAPPLPNNINTTNNTTAMPSKQITNNNNTNNNYQLMPESPNHGGLNTTYDQTKQEQQGHQQRGLWQTLMSLMTCGIH